MTYLTPTQISPEIIVPPEGWAYTTHSTTATGVHPGHRPNAALMFGNEPPGIHGAFSFGFAGTDFVNGVQTEYCAGVGMKSGVGTSDTHRSALETVCGIITLPEFVDVSDTSTTQQSTTLHAQFPHPASGVDPEKMGVICVRNNYSPQLPPLDPLVGPSVLAVPFHVGEGRVKTGKITVPTSGTLEITGVGFRPELIWFLTADTPFVQHIGPFPSSDYSVNHAYMTYGFADIQGTVAVPIIENRCMSFADTDAVGTTTAAAYNSDKFCLIRSVDPASGAIKQGFRVSAVTDDSFTINLTGTGVDTFECAYMALSLNNCHRRTKNTNDGVITPASTGTVHYTDVVDYPGSDFHPQGIITLLGQLSPYDTGRTNNQAATFGAGAQSKALFTGTGSAEHPWGGGTLGLGGSLTTQTDDAAATSLTYNSSSTKLFNVPKGVFTGSVPQAGVVGSWIQDLSVDYGDTGTNWSVEWTTTINTRLYPFIMFGAPGQSFALDTIDVALAAQVAVGRVDYGGLHQIVPVATVNVALAADHTAVPTHAMDASTINVAVAAIGTTVDLLYQATAETVEVVAEIQPGMDIDWDQTAYVDPVDVIVQRHGGLVHEGGEYSQHVPLTYLYVAARIYHDGYNPEVALSLDVAPPMAEFRILTEAFTVIQGAMLDVDTLDVALRAETDDLDVVVPPAHNMYINDPTGRKIEAEVIEGLAIVVMTDFYLDPEPVAVRFTPHNITRTGGVTNPMSFEIVAATSKAEALVAAAPKAKAIAGVPRAERVIAEALNG